MEASSQRRGIYTQTPGRTYSVTLHRPDLGIAMSAVTLPLRRQPEVTYITSFLLREVAKMKEEEERSGVEDWALQLAGEQKDEALTRLDLRELSPVSPMDLPKAIMLTGLGPDGVALARQPGWQQDHPLDELAYRFCPRNALDGLAFAEHLSYAPVIPVEMSPLSAQSLATLATGAGGTAALVAAGQDPLLAVKAGVGLSAVIVLVGTAQAVTEGLSYRIKRWFGVPDDDESSD